MLLSELVGKKIYSAGKIRGICRGVGIQVKTRAVKYIICSDVEKEKQLFLPISTMKEVLPSGISLRSFRPTNPQSVSRFFCSRPVYDEGGNYLGIAVDLEIENSLAVSLVTDTGTVYSAYSITAVSDAILLKRKLIFPLGEKIPKKLREQTNSPVVSKAVLKRAIEDGSLIRLTLSLPLFTKTPR